MLSDCIFLSLPFFFFLIFLFIYFARETFSVSIFIAEIILLDFLDSELASS